MPAEDVLIPNGIVIGRPSIGGDTSIRNVTGGPSAARQIFVQLSQGGMPYGGDYPGTAVQLPNSGFVGIRGVDTDHPTIDVNIPGIPQVSKLHF
jgi:hypothetical protein